MTSKQAPSSVVLSRDPATVISPSRWFYSLASLSLLVVTVIGFQRFYFAGQAFPGRPLTPPIRSLVITHGILMSLWMLLAVIQPLLVGMRFRRMHMKFGIVGIMLAIAMVVVGLRVGIESARFSPPDMLLFGLSPRQFMAVPVVGIVVFALFVLVGILYRRRSEIHRPAMLMATLSVVAAALGRIPQLNAIYAGTWWEQILSAFVLAVLTGAIMLVAKCMVSRSFDRWFAAAFASLTLACIVISLGAKTSVWDQFAQFLLR